MNLGRFVKQYQPRRGAGLAIGVAVLLAVALGPNQARAERRACRATEYYLEATVQEFVGGESTGTRTWRVSVPTGQMEVVASAAMPTIHQAKESSCNAAAFCLARQITRETYVCSGTGNLKYETVRRPPSIVAWRRNLACDSARTGQAPGLSRTNMNTVKLLRTKFVAVGHRDEVTRYADETVSESNHVCWQSPLDPDGVHHPLPGTPFPSPHPKPDPPPRPPKPLRPASDDLRVPFQVTAGSLEVTPSLYNGPCPAEIRLEASLTVVGKGTVRFRLNHKGGRGPIRTATFREGGTQESTASYTIGASGGGGPAEGMAAPGGSGGGSGSGIGGFQASTAPNQHTGWFEIEIVSPTSPFRKSQPAHYKVLCQPATTIQPSTAHLVPGTGGGGEQDPSRRPPAGAPDLVLLSASPTRDGACGLVVGNTGGSRSVQTTVRLTARGRKPIDIALLPIPLGGRQVVPVEGLGELRWEVHLDRSNAVRESDEDNNHASIQGCRAIGRR